MRRPKRLDDRTTLTLAVLALAALTGLTEPAAADDKGTRFELHRAYKACGKKWAKRAARLGGERLEWMLRRGHRMYRVATGGRTLMTLELLSTASFRDCNVAEHWSRRETSVRVTYHEPDGSTRVQLHHFANDDVHYAGELKLYAAQGRALLLGVTVDGRQSNRWLPLERLPALVAASRSEPAALVASAAVAAGDQQPVVMSAYALGGGQ